MEYLAELASGYPTNRSEAGSTEIHAREAFMTLPRCSIAGIPTDAFHPVEGAEIVTQEVVLAAKETIFRIQCHVQQKLYSERQVRASSWPS